MRSDTHLERGTIDLINCRMYLQNLFEESELKGREILGNHLAQYNVQVREFRRLRIAQEQSSCVIQ